MHVNVRLANMPIIIIIMIIIPLYTFSFFTRPLSRDLCHGLLLSLCYVITADLMCRFLVILYIVAHPLCAMFRVGLRSVVENLDIVTTTRYGGGKRGDDYDYEYESTRRGKRGAGGDDSPDGVNGTPYGDQSDGSRGSPRGGRGGPDDRSPRGGRGGPGGDQSPRGGSGDQSPRGGGSRDRIVPREAPRDDLAQPDDAGRPRDGTPDNKPKKKG